MGNYRLQKEAESVAGTIDALIEWGEKLEGENEQLEEKIEQHLDRIKELEEEVADLKSQLNDKNNY
jgi:predicted nuclease with TOPRIM domain